MMNARGVIVGAGISGIYTARALKNLGIQTTILEAQSSLGGRIRTNNRLGFPVDLGAFALYDIENNPLLPTINAAKMKHIPYHESISFNFQNTNHKINEENSDTNPFCQVLDFLTDKDREHVYSLSLKDAYFYFKRKYPTNNSTLEAYQKWYEMWSCCFFGAEWDKVSAKSWYEEQTLSGTTHILTSGFSEIFDVCATGLDIRYNNIVKHIHTKGDKVIVQCSDGYFETDFVVVTVPLGVLKANKIKFDPPLPISKQLAIDKLGYGTLEKVVLAFDTKFWPDDILFGSTDDNYGIIYHNYHHILGKNLIVGFAAGKAGRELANLPDEQFKKAILTSLKLALPDADVVPPISIMRTNWCENEFFNGSYCYLSTTDSQNHIRALSTPIKDKLYFAGEATHPEHYSTVHGAYLSSERVVNEIVMSYSNSKQCKL